jgi:excisionase family DNA binding protein
MQVGSSCAVSLSGDRWATCGQPVVADWRSSAVISVEDAGAVLGLGRSASYDAVRRGDIPVIKIGRRLLVPTALLRALIGELP